MAPTGIAGVVAQELPPPPWKAAAWTTTGVTPLIGVAATAEALTVVVVCQGGALTVELCGALDCPTTDMPSLTGVNWAGQEPRPPVYQVCVSATWGG